MCDFILKAINYLVDNLAAICSAACAILMYRHTRKVDKFTTNKNYYSKIFDRYLIDEIPNTREYIRYDYKSKTIKDSNKFTDKLEELRKNCLFYKYCDRGFYDDLNVKIQDIVDYTMNNCNYKMNEDEYIEKINMLNEKIKNLYEYIYKDYLL